MSVLGRVAGAIATGRGAWGGAGRGLAGAVRWQAPRDLAAGRAGTLPLRAFAAPAPAPAPLRAGLRAYATPARRPPPPSGSSRGVVAHKDPPAALPVVAKVVDAGKNATYVVFVVGAFTVLVGGVYMLVSTLFFGSSPYTMYDKSLNFLKNDSEVLSFLGSPVKGYGEGQRRRQHIPNQEFEYQGRRYMRIKYYAEGSRYKGVVLVEKCKIDGKWEYTHFAVQIPQIRHAINLKDRANGHVVPET